MRAYLSLDHEPHAHQRSGCDSVRIVGLRSFRTLVGAVLLPLLAFQGYLLALQVDDSVTAIDLCGIYLWYEITRPRVASSAQLAASSDIFEAVCQWRRTVCPRAPSGWCRSTQRSLLCHVIWPCSTLPLWLALLVRQRESCDQRQVNALLIFSPGSNELEALLEPHPFS